MTEAVERIKAELDGMSEDERMDIAKYLVALGQSDGDDSDDAELKDELERRYQDMLSGKTVSRPAFEALDELRKKYFG